MDRSTSLTCRDRRVWVLFTLALLVSGGCGLMANMAFIVSGQSVPAEFGELKGKRVAVVCRPVTSLQYHNSNVSRDLAKQISTLLEKNIPKIKVIDQREIAEWSDENNWDNYSEIGKALNVDYVVGVDLEEFSLFLGQQTLYQGKANLSLGIYDIHKGREPVLEKHLPQMIYPPTAPIPASDTPEPQFCRTFITHLAEQVARHFYEHDPTADWANDSTALR